MRFLIEIAKSSWRNGYIQPLLAWIIWMLIGTVFYSLYDGFGWALGFYMSVNVGYSIGWGDLHEDEVVSKFFSTIYVLIGASAISGCLAYFVDGILHRKDKWYLLALKAREMEELNKRRNITDRIFNFLYLYAPQIRAFSAFFLYILFGTIWSCSAIGWDFIDGVYFSVSSLSTGGLNPIPIGSPDWYYVVVAFYSCTGIPVMGIAVGELARLLIEVHEKARLDKNIKARYCKEELKMLKTLGISDEYQKVSKYEFLLLTLARLHIVDNDLIARIYKRFEELDVLKDNCLSYGELLEEVFPPGDSIATSSNSIDVSKVTNPIHYDRFYESKEGGLS